MLDAAVAVTAAALRFRRRPEADSSSGRVVSPPSELAVLWTDACCSLHAATLFIAGLRTSGQIGLSDASLDWQLARRQVDWASDEQMEALSQRKRAASVVADANGCELRPVLR